MCVCVCVHACVRACVCMYAPEYMCGSACMCKEGEGSHWLGKGMIEGYYSLNAVHMMDQTCSWGWGGVLDV